jgi:hypothetical protein
MNVLFEQVLKVREADSGCGKWDYLVSKLLIIFTPVDQNFLRQKDDLIEVVCRCITKDGSQGGMSGFLKTKFIQTMKKAESCRWFQGSIIQLNVN